MNYKISFKENPWNLLIISCWLKFLSSLKKKVAWMVAMTGKIAEIAST
jgi:hypothetical protein